MTYDFHHASKQCRVYDQMGDLCHVIPFGALDTRRWKLVSYEFDHQPIVPIIVPCEITSPKVPDDLQFPNRALELVLTRRFFSTTYDAFDDMICVFICFFSGRKEKLGLSGHKFPMEFNIYLIFRLYIRVL